MDIESPSNEVTIEYVTIATTGNALDFGSLTEKKGHIQDQMCISNSWCIWWWKDTPATVNTNVIEYVTISTTGNAQDFGDLTDSIK